MNYKNVMRVLDISGASIAKVLDVSPAAVSQALRNGSARVGAEVRTCILEHKNDKTSRAKVQEAITELEWFLEQ